MKKKITTVNETARRYLSISRDEYALCSYIHYRAAYNGQQSPGWCCDLKSEIADFIGISRAGLYKMIDRIEAKGLIESEPGTGFLRSTKDWADLENDSVNKVDTKQKSGVNKVDSECQLSRHDVSTKLTGGVNLVTHNIAVKEDIVGLSKNKTEQKAGKEKISHLEEGKKNTPPSSAAPPQSKKQKEGTPGYYADDFKDNYLIKEAYTLSRKLPIDKFLEHLRNWYIEASAQEQKYDCRKSAMNHFLAFAESREKYKAPKSSQIKKTNTLDYDDPETQPF